MSTQTNNTKDIVSIDTKDLIDSILSDFNNFNIDDIPGIDLYMDQVTTYLNNKFETTKRNDDDKLLTKTMVNNYTKSRLLPPPEKKKYSKDHIIILTIIYYLKNIISINDIDTAISPLISEYYHDGKDSMEKVFNLFIKYAKEIDDYSSIKSTYEKSKNCFLDLDAKNRDYLETLTLIAMLTYESLERKIIIERLIDTLPSIDKHSADEKTQKK